MTENLIYCSLATHLRKGMHVLWCYTGFESKLKYIFVTYLGKGIQVLWCYTDFESIINYHI